MTTWSTFSTRSLVGLDSAPSRPRVAVVAASEKRRVELAAMLRPAFEIVCVCNPTQLDSLGPDAKPACVVLYNDLADARVIDVLPLLRRESAVVVVGVPNEDAGLALMRYGAEDVMSEGDLVVRGLDTVVRRALARRAALAELCDAYRHREILERQLAHAQKMEALGRLAGGVAHDFNNVLTAILSFARFVVDQLAPGDPRRDDLVEVLKAADRARGLTRQLLTYSRRQPVEGRVTCVNDVVESVSELLRRTVGEDIRLELKLASDLKSVFMDPGQIEQIILNMVINARDAMPKGGTVTLSTLNTLHDFGDGEREVVVLRVRDNGLGMTDAVAARIFEPFFTTKARERGTGLGLSTCYGIVKRAEGDILVDTAPGRGTVFSVLLPCVAALVPSAEAPAHDAPAARRGELVLVVEDDDPVRTLTARMLRKHGYRALEAANTADARALFAAHRDTLALLVTDVVMADSRGPELARQLLRERPDLPVLFMTGYDDESLTIDVLRSLPRSRVLVKPFLEVSLLQKARELLDAEPLASPKAPASDRARVLVVDDDAERAQSVARQLAAACEVTQLVVTSDPITVFQSLAEASYDALVCGGMGDGFSSEDLLDFLALHYPALFERSYLVAAASTHADPQSRRPALAVAELSGRLLRELSCQQGAA